ncbi:hypothetical protein CVD28_01000 [Bacillus sp. M6-12]|uniref:hypothetical protein n=1 Tax=Bacillus sp. M6-12 TaxID=2054166 RepID=UPI000C786501|nr:hypothetical protein [Bacillus sp. M6-12]PLS19011.1 hypothetical protein CVD28_01000 [Bacillus sp. M6-12]
MIDWKIDFDSVILYKDEKKVGVISRPTVLIDTFMNKIIQVGDRENVETYYRIAKELCKKQDFNIYQHWRMVELPKDLNILYLVMENPKEALQFEVFRGKN